MRETVDQDKLAFCRVSELGFLRLLTNAHVLGKDVLSPAQAWRVYGWGSAGDKDVAALYWFYRYNPDGTFASRASVTDKVVLGSNGRFTSSGVVVDYDANGNLLTTGCFTHAATRLTTGFEPH
jgi:hypothetical protein